MKVVIDTNVLVSAVRSRQGSSFKLISSLPDSRFQPALSVALYSEWSDVLTRDEHLPEGTTPDQAIKFLRYLASISHLQEIFFLWRPYLRDPGDDLVLECAVASQSRYIITHNLRDFKTVELFGIIAITPARFLEHLRSNT